MKHLPAVLALVIALIIPAFGQGGGDESAFVRSNIGDMPIQLGNGVTINTTFFEAVRNNTGVSTSTYAFTPYFVFVTFRPGAQGDPQRYQVIGPLSDGTFNVQMHLACFDDVLKTAAASRLASSTGSNVNADALQVLPLFELRITEETTRSVANIPETRAADTRIELQSVQPILFRNLTANEKDRLTALIDNNQAHFTFRYSFKKAGTTLTSATVRLTDVTGTDTFHRLTGGGNSGSVSRDGMAVVATKMVNQLDVKTYLEDTADVNALVEKVLSLFFEKARFKEAIDFRVTNQLNVLSSLSIDPRGPDFEAARLRTTHEAVSTSRDFNEVNRKLREGGGSVGYGPFKADANFKSNEEVTQAVKDTFARDFTGDNYSTIPKTVNVYQITASDFQADTTLRLVTVRPNFFFQQLDKSPVQIFPSVENLQKAVTDTVHQKSAFRFGTEACRENDVRRCGGITNNGMLFDTGIRVRSGNVVDLDLHYLVREEVVSPPPPVARTFSNLVCVASTLTCDQLQTLTIDECINNERRQGVEAGLAGNKCRGFVLPTVCKKYSSVCSRTEDHWMQTTSFQKPVGTLRLSSPPNASTIPTILNRLWIRFTTIGARESQSVDCPFEQLQRVPGMTTGLSFIVANFGSCAPFSSDPADTKAISIFYKESPGIAWKEGVDVRLWNGSVTQSATDRMYVPVDILSGMLKLR